ncbi:MAG: PAS domain-containing protein [Pseudotabrizicola sp.]|uniref:PAS domain-containing protein n=1 Tax=Pseudotabrizicola sp. TaxID=2939647 RepID=UPI0027301B26|nr:PAS domain-containing protein [Pseudotabrizicola sp.]MDP2082807.1 PAS domain-containing protein [Pseudotabrizicola sp.]MDZ7576220.1 PAS domain-containing protein [Pseudotabrizicola sp.]
MTFGWKGRDSGGSDHQDKGLIAELRAYWEALREGEMLPRRDRVDPRGIAGALEHSFLIERIAPGVARFRISGMVFNDLMGMDIRGMPMSCLFLGPARDQLQLGLERVFRAPSIVTMDLLAERSLGRGNLCGRMQVLPMLSNKGESNLAIGCLEVSGEIGRAPRRFSITDTRLEPVHPTDAPPEPHAEPQIDPVLPRPPRAQPGVPYLRLVKA